MKKIRLDQYLTDNGLFESKSKAQGNILAGNVLVNDKVITKCGYQLNENDNIRIKEKIPYVSRGGIKLAGFLDEQKIDVADKIFIDVGSSTGGFTDCLLKRGTRLVYAVDVGTNQLAMKLRNDDRVISLEQFHANDLNTYNFDPKPEWAVIDVSFISLEKIIKSVMDTISGGKILALYKPQFEIGHLIPNFKGIVKDNEITLDGINKFGIFVKQYNYYIKSFSPCVISGPKGNREYFLEITT